MSAALAIAASPLDAPTTGLTLAPIEGPLTETEASLQPARDLLAKRKAELRPTLNPKSPYEEWLFDIAVVNMLRVENCHRAELDLSAYRAERAKLNWEHDRWLEAEETAAAISRRPALTVARLCRTRQGCDLLIERWLMLVRTVKCAPAPELTASQRSFAFDLMGTPRECRTHLPWADAGSPEALAGLQIARLEALKAQSLERLDEIDRQRAQAGIPFEHDSDFTAIRRYEAACRKQFEWAWDRLGAGARLNPPDEPAAETLPGPAPPEPAPSPPPRPRPAARANHKTRLLPAEMPNEANEPEPDSESIVPDETALLPVEDTTRPDRRRDRGRNQRRSHRSVDRPR